MEKRYIKPSCDVIAIANAEPLADLRVSGSQDPHDPDYPDVEGGGDNTLPGGLVVQPDVRNKWGPDNDDDLW